MAWCCRPVAVSDRSGGRSGGFLSWAKMHTEHAAANDIPIRNTRIDSSLSLRRAFRRPGLARTRILTEYITAALEVGLFHVQERGKEGPAYFPRLRTSS